MPGTVEKGHTTSGSAKEAGEGTFTPDVRNSGIGLKKIVAEIEKTYILKALEETGWIQIKAAERLGISQRMLGYKIKKYNITLKPKKGGGR